MKPNLHLIIWIIVIFNSQGYSQNYSTDAVSQIVQQIKNAIGSHDSWHYKAQEKFKEFGSDSFGIRNYSISYRLNINNPLYGYDWMISEVIESGYLFTWLFLKEKYYAIYEGNKSISQWDLPGKIEPGSYPNYIRTTLILNEIFHPFATSSAEDIKIVDSGYTFTLVLRLNELTVSKLIVNKGTSLPIQSINSITDSNFNLVQITEVKFDYDNQVNTIPNTALSPDYFISLGYALNYYNKSNSSDQFEIKSLNSEDLKFLLNYPFVSADGKTISISSSKTEYVLLDFWYASCLPCLKAMPVINQLANEYANDGLIVYGINCIDKNTSSNLESKLRSKGITFPLLYGINDLLQAMGIKSFPTYVLITPNQNVEFINGGIAEVKRKLFDIYNK